MDSSVYTGTGINSGPAKGVLELFNFPLELQKSHNYGTRTIFFIIILFQPWCWIRDVQSPVVNVAIMCNRQTQRQKKMQTTDHRDQGNPEKQ